MRKLETEDFRLSLKILRYLGTNPGEDEVSARLFTSSSLILIEFLVEFWSLHSNLLRSVYLFVVGFT